MSLDTSGEVVRARSTTQAGRSAALYEESQFFHPAVYGLLLLSAVVEGIALAAFVLRAEQSNLLILAGTGGVYAFILNALVLRTRVDQNDLHVVLGWIPIFWMHLALDSVTDVRSVEYQPLREAGGWGLRSGRFEGEKCRYWNARGNRGVFLATSERRYIIGSQRPEELYRVLKRGA